MPKSPQTKRDPVASLRDDPATRAGMLALVEQLKRFSESKPQRTVRSLLETELLVAACCCIGEWVRVRSELRKMEQDPFALNDSLDDVEAFGPAGLDELLS